MPGVQIDMVGPLTPESDIHRRKVTMDAGGSNTSERHYVAHTSLVTRGTVRCDWTNSDGTTGSSLHVADTKTDAIYIPAMRYHTFTAIDGPATWHCLFTSANTGGVIDGD